MTHKWNYQPITPEQAETSQKLAQELGISPILGGLLVQRGITKAQDAKKFFRPQLPDLHDPFLMKDMDVAVERLNKAMGKKERILIYGDYDVDGTTAVALVYKFIQQFYSNIDYYIPDRYNEGYGVSTKGVDYAAETGVGLIIVLDCGIKAVEEITYAKEKGIDFIICDHHVPDDVLPPAAAILNAKRLDNTYPYEHLSGCGVGFKFMQAFAISNGIEFHHLIPLLDLVAVSIASDIVPIMGENRILAFHGLKQLNSNPSVGLKAIIDVCGLTEKDITVSDIVFKIGPRINAAGRMDSPMDALELLLTMDARRAVQLAQMLDSHNRKRQEEEEAIRTDAVEMLHNSFDPERDNVIVLGSRAWHPGVVGIVASQLMRRYHKPTFVIAFDESGVGKGSGRSIPGVSLVQAIHHCADTLVSGGGHDMAAGLVIEESRMDDFRRAFNRYVSETTTEEQRSPVLNIDMEVSFQALTLDLLDSYEKLEPFGNSDPQPLFMSSDVFPTEPPKRVGTNHLKLFMRQGIVERDAIFFNGAERELPNPPWDIAFTIDRNVYRGRASLSISIQEIRSHREM